MKPNLTSGVFWGTAVTKVLGFLAFIGVVSPEAAENLPQLSESIAALVDTGFQVAGLLSIVFADIAYAVRRGLGDKGENKTK